MTTTSSICLIMKIVLWSPPLPHTIRSVASLPSHPLPCNPCRLFLPPSAADPPPPQVHRSITIPPFSIKWTAPHCPPTTTNSNNSSKSISQMTFKATCSRPLQWILAPWWNHHPHPWAWRTPPTYLSSMNLLILVRSSCIPPPPLVPLLVSFHSFCPLPFPFFWYAHPYHSLLHSTLLSYRHISLLFFV